MIYTLTLNPALDYTLVADSLRSGEINRASRAAFRFGGKGLNVSAMLERLGVPSVALGFAAGFTGQRLVELAEAEGVKCDFTVLSRGETRVNVKLRSTEELDVNAPGPEIAEADLDALCAKLSALEDGDTLVFSGSVPQNAPGGAAERILAMIAEKKTRLVADTTGAALEAALRRRPWLVKPNHVELAEFCGESAEDEAQIAVCARRVMNAGAKNVLVSRAEKGAMLFTEDGAAYSVGTVPGALVDSACCGDAALAGFLAGYERSGDFAQALRLAAACGNASAFCEGLAAAPDVGRIYERLENAVRRTDQ